MFNWLWQWFERTPKISPPRLEFVRREEANERLELETLWQFHERCLSKYPDSLIQPAVDTLRDELPEETKAQIRAAINEDPDEWFVPYHLWWGMAVRNFLREKGFGEEYWPICNLDDIYVPLVERAVKL